ncbi:MAG: hypothetical protein Q9159_007616 [Coniocarpon cinnabarinum]
MAQQAFMDNPDNDDLSNERYNNTTSATGAISLAFSLITLLASALVFFRTAIALLYGMSKGRKVGLTRVVELNASIAFVLLVILAVVVWAMDVWYYVELNKWFTYLTNMTEEELAETDPYSGKDFEAANHALLTQLKLSIAYEWIYVLFVTIFLPIVFLQVMGRRTDRVAILLYTIAILLVDALHIVEVARNAVVLEHGHPLTASETFTNGTQITNLVAKGLFQLVALYFLAFMGMRDPKLLVGEDDHAFAPLPQQQQPADQKWPTDTKYDPGATELPAAEHGLLENDRKEAHELGDTEAAPGELPGDDIAPASQPSSKVLRFLKRS